MSDQPHSRACGYLAHGHGMACHSDCPTCHGQEHPNFTGHPSRECGEHRTVGAHRAWCHDCSEWCYPGTPCRGCEMPQLREQIATLTAERDGLRAERNAVAVKVYDTQQEAERLRSEVRRIAEGGIAACHSREPEVLITHRDHAARYTALAALCDPQEAARARLAQRWHDKDANRAALVEGLAAAPVEAQEEGE